MDEVRFDLNRAPVPAARPRVTKWGVYYPKAHTDHEAFLKKALKDCPPFQVGGLIDARILSVMPPYKTSAYPTSRCDVDNLAKLPMDVMTKALVEGEVPTHQYWEDDNLVVSLTSLKRFARKGEEPHTKVRLIHIEGDVGEYVDRKFEE